MIIDEKNIPVQQNVVDRVTQDMLTYGMATFERMIPSAFDGLIPIYRRILFCCYKYKIIKEFIKVQQIMGYVIPYHPHGDASIAESICGMTQEGLKINHALLSDEDGSFGNMTSHRASSPRYISTKISNFGWDVAISLMDDNSMDMKDSEAHWGDKEPIFIPTKVPLILVNGGGNMAVSFVSDIPQHNLCDIVDIVVKFIKNKNIDVVDMVKDLYPDFVSGGIIVNGDEIQEKYYDLSNGVIKLRGVAEIDNANNRIIIKSLPIDHDFDSFRSKLKDVMSVKDSSNNPKNLVLSNISYCGESKDSIKGDPYIVVNCKNGSNLVEILDNLYKCTNLEDSVSIILNMNYNCRIRRATIKDIINDWYCANYIIRKRKLTYSINVNENRIHILEGLLKVYPNIDAVINIIKTSTENKDGVVLKLKNKFGLTLIQARSIYEMQLGNLTSRSEDDLKNSIIRLRNTIKGFEDDLFRIDDIMIEDALEIKKKYGRPRRTKIISKLKVRDDVIISNGAILTTRNSIGVFDSSNIISGKKILNGFKGVKINNVWVKEIINSHSIIDNIESVLVFYGNGSANIINPSNSINCWIPNNVEENGFIKAACPIYKNIKGSVMCITEDGSIKRFETDSITNRMTNLSTVVENCIFIPDGIEDKSMILVNEVGEFINIPISEITVKGRTAGGVLSSFKSGKNIHMAISGNNSHYVLLLEGKKLGDGFAYTQEISNIKIGTRTTKLRKLLPFDDFKFLGIGSVDLNIKDQIGLFISDNSTVSLKISNLKNLKSPRKINCKAFDFIPIEYVL